MEKFIIIGGDKRQESLYRLLSERGKFVKLMYEFGREDIASYTHIILPVPISKDKKTVFSRKADSDMPLSYISEKLSSGQTVFGGGFTEKFRKALEEKGVVCFDFMKQESFVTANAYLTAQGTLRLLLESTDEYIIGKKMLIIGFGRVAKALASLLKAVGADVYIAARNHLQLEEAQYCAYNPLSLGEMSGCLSDFSYIFGTVPSNILTEADIKLIGENCIYFELASAPFTADRNIFERYGKRFVFGGALPGKYLPGSSGRLLCEYILRFISENKE